MKREGERERKRERERERAVKEWKVVSRGSQFRREKPSRILIKAEALENYRMQSQSCKATQ